MYQSRVLSAAIVVGVAVGFTVIACGGGSSSHNPDAKVFKDSKVFMDSSGGGSSNGLGQLCPFGSGGGGSACPGTDGCVKITGVGSNANTGYCTPNCMGMNSICTTGYTGPSTGMPQCALSSGSGSAADGCAIVCTTSTDCPTGLTCTPVTGQSVSICVPS